MSAAEQDVEKAAVAAATAAHPEPPANELPMSKPDAPAVDDAAQTTAASTLSSPQNSQDTNSLDVSGDVKWVEFEANDPANPFNFSRARKWTTTIFAVIFTAEVAATAGAYVPGIPSMEQDLHLTNHEVSLLGISLYALGFGIPPLILAPFSEVFGRNPIYLVSHLCYTILFIGTGFANNITAMLILRFIQGGMGSTGSTMVGGTIADIWASHERGVPMGLFALAAIFGTGFGPFWAGFVEGNSGLQWRWIQWIQAMYTGGIFIVMVFFLRETRGSVILTRRAAKLRKETGDNRYRARAEAERASIAVLVRNSLTRPVWMLFSEPIVTVFSLWISFAWGFMYMLLESIGLVADLHGYTPGQTGLLFLSICLGAFLGWVTNFIQDYIYTRRVAKKGPEARLYSACVAAVLFPVGCFIYGWTSYSHVSIAGPIVGVTTLMLAVYVIYLAVFNYLADAYLVYASSALAGQSFARNMFGFAFPLFVDATYNNLGYQWASSLAGFLGAALGVVPFVLLAVGHRVRAKSRFSLELQRLYASQAK